MTDPGHNDRLTPSSPRLPLLAGAADPLILLVLVGLGLLAALGTAFAGQVFPDDHDARGHVIQIAAGVLVLLGAYFTAVTVREARAQQAFERLQKTIDQLGSNSEAVRIGAIRPLEGIAWEKLDLPNSSSAAAVTASRPLAVWDVLSAVANEPAGTAPALARAVLDDLKDHGFSAPDDAYPRT